MTVVLILIAVVLLVLVLAAVWFGRPRRPKSGREYVERERMLW